uniref:ribosomal protein S2 n=1 Tax=Scytothamnus australis TaxID=66621 RepID=UPI002E775063|nr:ribosomal protein S2 [Scytothamnus australis]WBP70290.1 ribosomal protein S2 [Scytothamnus australis]
MLKNNHTRLLSLFVNSSGYLIPLHRNEKLKVSKTMHYYVLGKQRLYYFYDLEKSLYCIRAGLESLKTISLGGGEVLFVSNSRLFHLVRAKSNRFRCIKWKRGGLWALGEFDMIFLDNVNKENLVEAHRKTGLLVGIASPTASGMAYPFNLNVGSSLLQDWLLSALSSCCLREGKTKNDPFPGLLGKGKKIDNYNNRMKPSKKKESYKNAKKRNVNEIKT